MAVFGNYFSVARTSLWMLKSIVRPTSSVFVRHQCTQHAPPKRPLSAFVTFYMQQRSAIEQSKPGLSVVELSREAGTRWRNLSEDERQEFLEESRRQFEDYQQRRTSYLDSLSAEERAKLEDEAKRKQQKRAAHKHRMLMKELNKPSRGMINGFMCFCSSHMLDRGDAQIQQFVKGLAEYWKQMSEEEKKPFEEQAAANRLKYKQELVIWEQNMSAEGRPELIRGYKAVEKKAKYKKRAKKQQKGGDEEEDTSWMREE